MIHREAEGGTFAIHHVSGTKQSRACYAATAIRVFRVFLLEILERLVFLTPPLMESLSMLRRI